MYQPNFWQRAGIQKRQQGITPEKAIRLFKTLGGGMDLKKTTDPAQDFWRMCSLMLKTMSIDEVCRKLELTPADLAAHGVC